MTPLSELLNALGNWYDAPGTPQEDRLRGAFERYRAWAAEPRTESVLRIDPGRAVVGGREIEP